MDSTKKLKICSKGHRYSKSSNCPTCPICEANRKPLSGFQTALSAPARRALEHAKISTLKQLATCTESTIKNLHGMGPSAMIKLREALKQAGLSFKK
ncbi:MAG: hypothetical protein IPP32_15705 [Bacteroidetes bacterium]|nr:hypothetical protein [Bacteroidota bacterium]